LGLSDIAVFHAIPLPTVDYLAPVVCAVLIVLLFPVLAACIFIVERRILAEVQARSSALNPNSYGVLQPAADAVDLVLQEDVMSRNADPLLYWAAPLIGLLAIVLAFAVLPISPAFQVADLNIGLVFVMGVSSLGSYGILLSGWASNRRDAALAALHSCAGWIGYETAGALGLISALLLSGSLSMKEIVQSQLDQGQWFIFYVPVGFLIYFIGSLVQTKRVSDVSFDAGTEIAAGVRAGYGGFRWLLDFLAEYANTILLASVGTIVFLGGWLRPLASYRDRFPDTSIELLDVLPAVGMISLAVYCFRRPPKFPLEIQRTIKLSLGGLCVAAAVLLSASLFAPEPVMQSVHGAFWFIVKVSAYIYCCFWIRCTFLRPLPDALKHLAWRMLVPTALLNLITTGAAILTSQSTGLPMRLTTILSTAATLAAAWWIFRNTAYESAWLAEDGE
jgi:NADH-quinone oxidoreductase subunit H